MGHAPLDELLVARQDGAVHVVSQYAGDPPRKCAEAFMVSLFSRSSLVR
jgi:hypothetical protein